MFDKYKNAMQREAPSAYTDKRLSEAFAKPEKVVVVPEKRCLGRKISIISVCTALCLIVSVIAVSNLGRENTVTDHSGTQNSYSGTGAVRLSGVTYKDLFGVIESLQNQYASDPAEGEKFNLFEGIIDMFTGGVKGDSAAPEDDMLVDTEGTVDSYTNSTGEYSETNTQVEGIDEADIVKTDGKYIYAAFDGDTVAIIRAEKGELTLVSKIALKGAKIHEMYLSSDKLTVISDNFGGVSLLSGLDGEINQSTNYDSSSMLKMTCAAVFDVTDPSHPKYQKVMGQDGYYISSRMTDGRLLMFTNMYYYDKCSEDSLLSYVPCVFAGSDKKVLSEKELAIAAEISAPSYLVACAYDTLDLELISRFAMLGGGNTLYVNSLSAYIAMGRYKTKEKDGKTVGGKSVTDIVRFSVTEKGLESPLTVTVDGAVLNQFSMDEKDGYLRLVTTENESKYTEHGEFYTSTQSVTGASVRIFDGTLKKVGEITGIAKGEQVYSVRFMGDIAYFVTYYQTDPLFTVDLTDPTAPKIIGKLKIPGFSEYLHPWGEGRLFGFGKTDDGYLKLSMFNTEDPTKVTEITVQALNSHYSAASSNHKAIVVSYDRGLIAFQADNGYRVYSYADKTGFVKLAEIELSNYDCRGLYIGDYFYVCDNESVSSYDMTENFTLKSNLNCRVA